MLSKEATWNLVAHWGLWLVISFLAGSAMASFGYTIEAGYFWPRQFVIWAILAVPATITIRAYLKAKREE